MEGDLEILGSRYWELLNKKCSGQWFKADKAIISG